MGVGFAVVGWFRRARPFPSSAGLVPCPSASAFLSLAFSGLPVLGYVSCVGVFSFPLLLRSPLHVLVK